MHFLLTDHLGSVVAVLDDQGVVESEQRYLPYGGERYAAGIDETDYGYTGQRDLQDLGLMDYNARFYSPTIRRLISADTLIPDPSSSQAFNRYSYVTGNPLVFVDPSGHYWVEDEEQEGPTERFIERFVASKSTTSLVYNNLNADDSGLPNQDEPIISDYYWEPYYPETLKPLDPSITQSQNNQFNDLLSGLDFIKYFSHDLFFEPLRQIYNHGYPVYKQSKGLIPFDPFLEMAIGGAFQFLGDLSNDQLTWEKKYLRSLVIALEDGAIDVVSSYGGGTVGAFLFGGPAVLDGIPYDEIPGAGLGYFIGMDITTLWLTEKRDEWNASHFPGFFE